MLADDKTKDACDPDRKSGSEDVDQQSTSEEREIVKELQAIDRKVRSHELAHLAAAGQYATSGARFDLQKGPDGRSYAVGGEVSIDTSAVEGDPEATIRKAQIIRAAALAPENPSSQDRSVAAQATRMEGEARMELTRRRRGETGDAVAVLGELIDVWG